jgi:hypothetical protein
MNYDIFRYITVESVRFQHGNSTPITGPNTGGQTPITDAMVRATVNTTALEALGATSDVRYLANLICATKTILDLMDPVGVRPVEFYNAFATQTGWTIVDPINALYCTADQDISMGSQVFGFDATLYATIQTMVPLATAARASRGWIPAAPFWSRFVGSVVEVD